MPEAYVGAEANAFDLVAGWLSNCAVFQTLTGTGSAAAARAYIVEGYSTASPFTTAHAVLTMGDVDLERVSDADWFGSLAVDVNVFWPDYSGPVPPANEAYRRALGHGATIRTQLQALVGGQVGKIGSIPPMKLEESASTMAGWWSFMLTATLLVKEP